MKIYTKVVIDIDTGETLSEDFYEYYGEIDECKGGSTTTNTVDPAYNAGMLALSQEQQGWAKQAWNMFQYGVNYDPSETVYGYYDGSGKFVNVDPAVNPELAQVTTTMGDVNNYTKTNTPEMEYLQNVVDANQDLLGLQTHVSKQQLQLKSTLLDDINNGINIGERMDQAQAGVQHGFKLARKASDMNLASYGLDPNSGKFASANRGLALSEATGIAGARTQAKTAAETEDFNRKIAGLQI